MLQKNVVPNVRKLVNMFCARPCFHSLAPVRRKALHCTGGATDSATRDSELTNARSDFSGRLRNVQQTAFKVRVKRKYPNAVCSPQSILTKSASGYLPSYTQR